jgi:hypothetical protein
MEDLHYIDYLGEIVVGVVYLAGLVASIILLVKTKRKPPIAAIVAFALLLFQNAGWFFRALFVEDLLREHMDSITEPLAVALLGCSCTVVHVVAFVCLIGSLWSSVSRGEHI